MPYTESVVTFIDILGFGSMVSDRSRHDTIDNILSRLKERTQFEQYQTEGNQQRFTNFSDCCVRSTPIVRTDGEWNGFGILAHEILTIVHAQMTLIMSEGVFLRGAITLGDIHHEDGTVFGPALVRAYQLESTVAEYPRIIIDPRIIERFRTSEDLDSDWHDHDQEMGYVADWLKKGSDGLYFIDYLRLVISESDNTAEALEFFRRHRDLITEQANLNENRLGIAVKYNWLIEYHNTYISSLNNDALEEYDAVADNFLINTNDIEFHQSLPNESIEDPE